MPSNIEIKARVADLEAVRRRALGLGAEERGTMQQVDTYFQVPEGRLKLREIDGSRAELIFYRRPDQAAAKRSEYRIVPVGEAGAVRELLAAALGVRARVEKRRHLLIYRHTRIHLDAVLGLGEFVELETVLDGLSEEAGAAESAAVREALEIRDEELLEGSYGEMVVLFGAAVPTF